MFSQRIMIVAIILAFLLPQGAFAQTVKFGYVDYARILLEVEDGKAAKARLQVWLDARQKEIDKEQEALRKEKELLDKQASAMGEDTYRQKAVDLQKKVIELSQKWERSRGEAAEKERKEMEPILGKLDGVVASIATKGGYAFIFEKRESGIKFALATYDITNDTIRAYNALPKTTDPKVVPKK